MQLLISLKAELNFETKLLNWSCHVYASQGSRLAKEVGTLKKSLTERWQLKIHQVCHEALTCPTN